MRIHRGRPVMQGHNINSNGSNSTVTNACNSPRNASHGESPEASRLNRAATNRNFDGNTSERVSNPSSDTICSSANNTGVTPETAQSSKKNSLTSDSVQPYSVHYSSNTNQSQVVKSRDCHPRVPGPLRRKSSSETAELTPSPTFDESTANKAELNSEMGKRSMKAQMKQFHMDRKAEKSLGIIVSGFIFCWLPFFTVYLIRVFCVSCINPVVFSTLAWLGYCNSAINPFIYALYSKDFRFAFQGIIRRCFCGRKSEQPRGLDGS